MIRSVRIRGFKRFRDIELHLPGHAVLTGPNDIGKTTLLQAIASWQQQHLLEAAARTGGRLVKAIVSVFGGKIKMPCAI